MSLDRFDKPQKNFSSPFIEASEQSLDDDATHNEQNKLKIEKSPENKAVAEVEEHFVLSRAMDID